MHSSPPLYPYLGRRPLGLSQGLGRGRGGQCLLCITLVGNSDTKPNQKERQQESKIKQERVQTDLKN